MGRFILVNVIAILVLRLKKSLIGKRNIHLKHYPDKSTLDSKN